MCLSLFTTLLWMSEHLPFTQTSPVSYDERRGPLLYFYTVVFIVTFTDHHLRHHNCFRKRRSNSFMVNLYTLGSRLSPYSLIEWSVGVEGAFITDTLDQRCLQGRSCLVRRTLSVGTHRGRYLTYDSKVGIDKVTYQVPSLYGGSTPEGLMS